MIVDYLQRGILAGVVAGLAYGMYMAFVANPLSEYLHDTQHEHGHDEHGHDDHGHGHGHGEHVHEHAEHAVSETTTALVSIGSGALWAIFLGGLFALALYVLEPALPGPDGIKTYVLAGAGFISVSVTPWLVLPPAAPGAEQLYSIESRLAIYVALIALGAVVSAASIAAYRRTATRHPAIGVAAGAVPIAAMLAVVPSITPTVVTHPELSSALVSAYRALAVLSQAAIWVLLAGTFNWLQRRADPATAVDGSHETLTTKQ
ncbi:cobalamin cluster protein [Natronorubrum sp. JWXQ-INN-674]|uniref:Cobalamin cluster protein n=1 Tax=Natronorubrum halalkaliphilum TaxID=2691917 RepID=A0A6B0VTI4_9EURY|nr:CbtA family protein [Natronorubrum halalkaliphilum]MXV63839.1 cobalamin cluster protein [Natronorubrum halalkaliphilum]